MTTTVSFEIAKLLKEKEFDNITDLIYMTNHTTEVLFENINQLRHSDGNNPFCSAPTIAEVVMWLYEKHGIWISIVRNDTKDLFNYVITWHNGLCENETRGRGYCLPKEAYEAAIDYILNNLI